MKVITVSGASGSGKTTLAKLLKKGSKSSNLWSLDDYYMNEKLQIARNGFCNFDHPKSIDVELLRENIKELKSIGETKMPQYCFSSRDRVGYKAIRAKDLLIVEGLFAGSLISEKSGLDIYVDVDPDLALLRRIDRDIVERQRTIENISDQYLKYVRPAFNKYIKIIKDCADIVVENNKDFDDLNCEVDKILEHPFFLKTC